MSDGRRRHADSADRARGTDSARDGSPSGTPAWVTAELVERTVCTWQPFYDEPLTAEDGLRILLDVGRLLDLCEGNDEQFNA